MNVKGFCKMVAFFALVLCVVLAGCDFVSDDEDEKSGGSGNSSGNEGSSQGVPVLVEGAWTDGTISKDGQTDTYSIVVSKGTRYFVYLNDKSNGDGSKTAYIVGMKLYNGNTPISSSYTYDCWEKPFTFIALENSTVTITTASNSSSSSYTWEKGTGTYGIRYTTRLEYKVLSEEGEWENDDIITDGQTNKYSLNVAAGTRYFIYLNDSSCGDGSKTAYRIGMKLYNGNTPISSSYTYDCWEKPFTFIALENSTVTITTASNSSSSSYTWEKGTGTYGIRYTTRPEYKVLSEEGEWKDDSIIATGQTNKYSINVVAGTQYSIYLNDGYEGDGSKTANRIGLKIIYTQDSNSDNPVICKSYSSACKLYVKPYTFTAPSTGTIIITAAVYSSGDWENGIGTYAIKYTSGS